MNMSKVSKYRASPTQRLVDALKPFVEAFEKIEHPGHSDLYNEQPINVSVTLGDIRRARAVLRANSPGF